MKSKKIDLTYNQCAELVEMQKELMRMCTADPEKRGCILAQVFPDQGMMRIKVFDHVIVRQLVAILPPVEENEIKAD